MICAVALPVVAAGPCLDREPEAPWMRFGGGEKAMKLDDLLSKRLLGFVCEDKQL